MLKHISYGLAISGVLLLGTAVASAHVVVKPAQVGLASFQTFTTGVPNEKEIAVTGLRVVMPEGLHFVSPTVKPGWTIEEKKSGTGEDATVTEITWTGGSIPAGQRDDFTFSAQSPATSGELTWKAYQTYADGTVVAWDQKPGADESDETGPYSVTKVVDDLASTDSVVAGTDNVSRALAVAALALAVVGFIASMRRKA